MAEAKKKTNQIETEAKETKTTKVKKAEISKETEVKETAEATPAAKSTAKAGKRSAKSQAEAEEKATKEAKKADEAATEDKPVKAVYTPKKPEHMHSKKWRNAVKEIDRTKVYELVEAITLVKKMSSTKFDATLELQVNLGIDPRQSDQQVRSSVTLPAGNGKTVRVAVIADDKNAAIAKSAGADMVDAEKILAAIAKEKFDFDVLVTTPDQMAAMAKHAKVLGPKGLMPSPKAGTVTPDVKKTVEEIKAGKVEIKTDSSGIVHMAVGKVSFDDSKLADNIRAALGAIVKAKPSGAKGTYLRSVALSATMSPSVKLDTAKIS